MRVRAGGGNGGMGPPPPAREPDAARGASAARYAKTQVLPMSTATK